MKFTVDHDYHIHSHLSFCSDDPLQSNERILQYARENGLKTICLTNHFWDSDVPGANGWYQEQNYAHICEALPLPQSETAAFYFGCEVDMDKHMTVGIAEKNMDQFDFIVVSTTHLHMTGFTIDSCDTALDRRAELYVKRLEHVLHMNFPAGKTGIAHLVCPHIAPEHPEDHLAVIDQISDGIFKSLFQGAREKGFGIELNMLVSRYSDAELKRALRPFQLAKRCGCKFYLGSDAHHPDRFASSLANFRRIVELLDLEETDKFLPFG